MDGDTIIAAVTGVTKKWTKQRKAEERQASAAVNRAYAMAPRRRIISALLRQGRYAEALEAARELKRIDPTSTRSAPFLRAAREAVTATEQNPASSSSRPTLAARIQRLPVTKQAEIQSLKQSFHCLTRAVD